MTPIDRYLKLNYIPPVMRRDRRLTGYLRGQTDQVLAPPGFELNNPWRVSKQGFLFFIHPKTDFDFSGRIPYEMTMYDVQKMEDQSTGLSMASFLHV